MSMRKALNQEPTGTVFDEQERQKILRLNRETRDTPQEPRLEWIYTGDRAQADDYLLGKKLDSDNKSINALADGVSAENTTTSTIDLANKIREDPLFLIKKKEIEQRKRILENPVRLKQLRDLLERQESGQSSSPPHKRKHRHSRSPSPPRRQRPRSPPEPARRRRSRSPPPAHRRRSPIPPTQYRRRRTPSPRRRRTPPPASRAPQRSEKPSKDDRERRIREMLVDGAVRNEQRQQNVRSYRDRDEQEEKINEKLRERPKKKTNKDSSSDDDNEHDFIQPMMKQIVDDPNLRRRDLKHHHHHKRR